MCRSLLVVFSVVYLFISCSNRTSSRLMEHEGLFLNDFMGHSLLIRGEMVEMQIYKGELMNDYFFRMHDHAFTLTRDSIQFDIKELPQYKELDSSNRSDYSKRIEAIAWRLFSEMKEADVASFTSEFRKFGVDLMINTKDHKLVYVSDTLKVANPEWRKFLAESARIKDHWYLYKMPF